MEKKSHDFDSYFESTQRKNWFAWWPYNNMIALCTQDTNLAIETELNWQGSSANASTIIILYQRRSGLTCACSLTERYNCSGGTVADITGHVRRRLKNNVLTVATATFIFIDVKWTTMCTVYVASSTTTQ